MSMFSQYPFHPTPVAPAASIVASASQRITVLTDGLLRFESDPSGKFEDRASTFAINRDFPTPKFQVIKKNDGSGGLEIITEKLHLLWTGEEFSPSSLHVLLRDKGWENKGWTHEWRYGDRHFKMTNLGGTYRTLDRIDGRCDLGDGILSQYGLSIVDDSESMLFTEDGWVAGRDAGKSDIYLFAYGLDYRGALNAFYTVSGKTPLIPRWALGNWWSRYYAYSQQEYLDLMDRFKKEKIPLSVGVLDIDWHLIDVPAEYGTGWTGYTWDKKLFPDHIQFMKDLHERNLKVSLNVHPADGVRTFETAYEEMCKALNRDSSTGVPVPFESTSKEFLEAYFKLLHHPHEDEGVDFWWMDWQQGPFSEKKGLDPLWILNHYHFLDSGRKGQRRFTFSRYAGPGSHRYPIGFSGDTVISWASLDFQPEFTATASNVGYGWWSNDIGGHYHGIKDDELYARWVQLGCFSPILRLHSSQSPFNSREPWVFGREAQDVATKTLQYRHRLIPYLYSLSVKAATTGENIVEPIYYDYPKYTEAYQNKNQFFFGNQIMVLPITAQSDPKTKLGNVQGWLPPARWVDLFSGLVYDGDRTVSLYRNLDGYPVFAKEGAVIPLDGKHGSEIENGAGVPESIEIVLVVGADGSFDLVEDDGTGAGIQDVTLSTTPIRYEQSTGTLTIGASENPLLKERSWSVRLPAHTGSAVSLQVDSLESVPTPKFKDGVAFLGKFSTSSTITLVLGQTPQLDVVDPKPRIFRLLQDAQIGTDLKGDIWDAVQGFGKVSVGVVLSRLNAAAGNEKIKEAIEELLLADGRPLAA